MDKHAINPKLVLDTGIGQKPLPAQTRAYISDVVRYMPEIQGLSSDQIEETFKTFYGGRREDSVLWTILSVFEFVSSSVRIYQTLPGIPFSMVVGVNNTRYPTSAVAFMPSVNPSCLTEFHTRMRKLQTTRWWHTEQGKNDMFVLMQTMYKTDVAPILHAMQSVRFAGIKDSQRQWWRF